MSVSDQMHADELWEDPAAEDNASLPAAGLFSHTLIDEARQERDTRTARQERGLKLGDAPGFTKSAAGTSREQETDEVLFSLYQQGDQQAFLVLYSRYKQNIYAYCARALLSAGLEVDHVEDTFQEVFLRIAQYQHTFVGGEFKAWIFTITRHSCLSAKKKAVKMRITTEFVGDAENLDDDTSNEVRQALSRTDDPLEAMAKQEQTDLLLKAIQALPESYREALILSEYEGLTYDEIGRLTGTSLSTIRIRIFRAKARLRKTLLPIIGDERLRKTLSTDEE